MVHFFLFLNLYPFFSLQYFLNNWAHRPFYFCILNCVFFFSIWLLQRWIGDHVAVASLGRSCIQRRQVLTCQSIEGTHLDFSIYKKETTCVRAWVGSLGLPGFYPWGPYMEEVNCFSRHMVGKITRETRNHAHSCELCWIWYCGFSEFHILGVTRSMTMIWWEWRPCQLHWSLHST